MVGPWMTFHSGAERIVGGIAQEIVERLVAVVSRAGFGPVMQNKENLAALKKKNMDPELQAALEKGLSNVVDLTLTTKDRIYRNFFYMDHMYFRGRLHRIWMSVVHPY